ncbi:MAG: glycosyltransferase [Eubacteriales bacterium]|nr:glycosyltransferase [Eubacteriales bacterium]
MEKKIISVVVPCYKASQLLDILTERIRNTIEARDNYDYEIVYVNDSPFDEDTTAKIDELCEKDSRIIGVHQLKNFGQDIARITGMHFATGDIVINMDDDGEHPPEEMFKLIEKVEDGYDVVYAQLLEKKHPPLKRLTSRINAHVMDFLGNKKKGVDTTAYVAYSKICAQKITEYSSPFPVISSFVYQITDKMIMVPIKHDERIAGETGYTTLRRIKEELSVMTSFSIKPLRISALMGTVFAVLGFIWAIVTIVRHFVDPELTMGYASLLSVVLIIGGIILVILGLIGEYLGRIYMIVNDKPQFVVRRAVNSDRRRETEKQS